ncbi:MAG TPA: cytochrome C [Methylosinus sp.]|jgi:thiosulfate dehydrogenase|uniref:cytochrome C n=1 Tax=Methylosinus sp. TaxID=427 RepID=UPI002F91C303
MLRSTLLLALGLATIGATATRADEFTKTDIERYQKEFDLVAAKGRELWTSGALGTNGVACAQCHPNAANTHPETYPKFQKQLGKVAQLFEMVNWCIRNPLQGANLAPDDPRMTALVSYITFERRGVKLAPGQH